MLAQAWHNLLLDHHFEFRRNTGGEEHQAVIQLQTENARGAYRIIQHLGVSRYLRLFAVGDGHRPTALGEIGLNTCLAMWHVQPTQPYAVGISGGQCAEIIAGWP